MAARANPAIDMEGYLRVSREAAAHRETRRVSEEEFIRMSREPGTVILDARSREKIARASLNLSTYIALYSYGYRNVYELGPLIDIKASKLEFATR
ncbi:MAG: hypothetical protein ACREUS_04630 [Burkholderiales bacterium]